MQGTNRFRIYPSDKIKELAKETKQPARTAQIRKVSTLSACRRCRQQKKRCTRTAEGPCTSCTGALLPCSLTEADSSEHPRDRELKSRVKWLSSLVNQRLPRGTCPIESVETGANISLGPVQEAQSSRDGRIDQERDGGQPSAEAGTESGQSILIPHGRRCLQAYFRHVHRAYSFCDSEATLECFEKLLTINEHCEGNSLPLAAIPSRLQMMIAIGLTTLQRAGEMNDIQDGLFQPNLQEVLCECLTRINEESAGTLLLLGLFLLFKPNDMDPRTVAGVLVRHASTIGLFSDPRNSSSFTSRELEFRRRLGWSIFVYDRMIGVSYGLSCGFPLSSMQIPLPSIMIHEYAAEERHQYTISLQVNRHVIALRQLETSILSFLQNKGSPYSLEELQRQIEDWYTHGCLLSSSALWEQDQLPFHTTITWLNVRHQNLILLLHTPTQGGHVAKKNLPTLQAASQQYIRLSLVLQQRGHLPINWITLCRLLSLAAILFYCLGEYLAGYPDMPEIVDLGSLLGLFPSTWRAAHEARDILQKLMEIMSNHKIRLSVLTESPGGSVTAQSPLDTDLMFQSIHKDLETLLKSTLGDSSIYTWPLKKEAFDTSLSTRRVDMNNVGTVNLRSSPRSTPYIAPDYSLELPTGFGEAHIETQWMSYFGGLGPDML